MISTLLEVLRRGPKDPVYLPLLSSPLPAVIIILIYLLVVFKIGPDFMECRKPFNVKSAMLKYNIFQITMNAILFALGCYYLVVKNYFDIRCMEISLDDPIKYVDRVLTYVYFLNKVLDLCDTVFFVLRKSYNQVTVLHVYHHALMVIAVPTTYYLYGSSGSYALMGYINSLVHVVMYSYYFAAALYPSVRNRLWLKKSITTMQIVQFVICLLHASLVWSLNKSCSIPGIMHFAEIAVAISMIAMFGNFYYQTYIRVKSKKTN
ncbi:elongation of very long chain fatty acids protein F [Drosophila serrata]|uniref:elongation of very long chain fatty acids protein F n=1 Tax=Drosophila serrata TaxID=7274 RepID=UPI000A1D1540|nr:elongation of very long chain fatty acids protein F [Drosophila serrata]